MEVPDSFYALVEKVWSDQQGLGGATTALAAHIESAWNLQCWRAERRRAKI